MDYRVIKVEDYNRLQLIASHAAIQLFQFQEYIQLVTYISENNVRTREQLLKCVDNFEQLKSDRDVLVRLLGKNSNISFSPEQEKMEEKELTYYSNNVVEMFPNRTSISKKSRY